MANIIRWYDHQVYLKDPRDPSLRRDLPGFRISPRFWATIRRRRSSATWPESTSPGSSSRSRTGGPRSTRARRFCRPSLIRNIARAAGCHIYSDAGDNVYASRNFLGIYAPDGGSRILRLPRKSRVIDLLEDKVLADGVTELPLKLSPNQTVLLKLESPSK